MLALGIDPGETAGFCLMEVDKENPINTKPLELGQFRHEDFEDWAKKYIADRDGLELVVIEDYRVYKQYAGRHAGDRLITARMLGKVETLCASLGITYIEQMADVLPIAQKWTQMKMPKNHAVSHQISALNHVRFYLIKNKMDLSALARERKKD